MTERDLTQNLLDSWPDDGLVVTREQARVLIEGGAIEARADLVTAIVAAVEGLPEHGEWSERCGWVGAITKAAVLDAIREASDG